MNTEGNDPLGDLDVLGETIRRASEARTARLRKLDALLASEEPPEGLAAILSDDRVTAEYGWREGGWAKEAAADAWGWFREQFAQNSEGISGKTPGAEVATLLEILREVEWDDERKTCPVCGMLSGKFGGTGHSEDCRLGQALSGGGHDQG